MSVFHDEQCVLLRNGSENYVIGNVLKKFVAWLHNNIILRQAPRPSGRLSQQPTALLCVCVGGGHM